MQTNIPLETESPQIDYSSDIVLLGSCFTGNIGWKLDYFKFRNLQNPFGIVFHPIAMERLIKRAITRDQFMAGDLFEQGGVWHCLEVHSLINHSEKNACLKLLNDLLEQLRESLEKASHLIITYGTAWGYRYLKSDLLVANCHKIPQKEFRKELTSVSDIGTSIMSSLSAVRQINPEIVIITTVSPVRHLKDGFVENTRSKAHLITAVHKAIESMENTTYFPSYEIMMDELRDYRFYADDMLHPSAMAVDIIWERFSKVWIAPETNSLREQIAEIQLAMQHKPFNPESEAHQKFLSRLQKKTEAIRRQLPFIEFDAN